MPPWCCLSRARPTASSLTTPPKESAHLEILDSEGRLVRRLEAKDLVAGLNRVSWDLRYESPRVVALRTLAPDNARIWQEPRFRDEDSRPITHWGSKPAEVGPVVAPGSYSVRLKVAGQSLTEPLTVVRDPRAPGSDADIELSVRTLVRIRDDISHVSDSVNQLEWLRRQLEVIEAMLRPAQGHGKPAAVLAEEGDEPDEEPAAAPERELHAAEQQQHAELLKAAEALDQKLQSAESRLVSRALRDSDDKYFVEADGTYLDLIWLNAEVGTGGGDVAGGADFAPTEAQLETLKTLEAEMSAVDSDLKDLMGHDLPALDSALERASLAPLAH
jgi:hypothetical protein